MLREDIFTKGSFEIPHKISYPYIEKCEVYMMLKIWKL